MFCPQCGTKIEEEAKFCKKCGHKMVAKKASKEDGPKEKLKEEIKKEIEGEESEKKELKEEIKKELKEEKPVAKTNWLSGCSLSILIMMFTLGIVTVSTGTEADKAISYGLITWSVIILGGWFGVWLLIKIIKAFITNWRRATVASVIIAILIISPILIIVNVTKTKARDNFSAFQNSFSDIIAVKYLGDDILAGKSGADFGTLKAISQAAVDNMAKEKSDDKYEKAMFDWAGKINAAATSKKSWKNLPDLPNSIGETLNSSTANNLFQASLDLVAATKDYGDWAIAKGDKDIMRQIAAELKAEETWQNNLSDQLTLDITSTAYAATNSVKTPRAGISRGRCGDFAPCRKKTGPIIGKLSGAARNYAVGAADAAQQWNDSWKDLLNNIAINNGYNLGATGVIQNGEAKQQISPMEQAFNDECQTKGGTTGGTGGVKDRLPTTLSAGTLTCNYPNNSRSCWDVMTRTGQRFMGGDAGCQEQGLVPKPAPTPTPTSVQESWNGIYHVSYTAVRCNVSGGGYSSALSAAGVSDTVTVKGGKVHNFDGSTSDIDSSGNASFNFPYSYGGLGTMNTLMTYHFSGNSVSGKVEMNISASSGGATARVTCSETFNGSK